MYCLFLVIKRFPSLIINIFLIVTGDYEDITNCGISLFDNLPNLICLNISSRYLMDKILLERIRNLKKFCVDLRINIEKQPLCNFLKTANNFEEVIVIEGNSSYVNQYFIATVKYLKSRNSDRSLRLFAQEVSYDTWTAVRKLIMFISRISKINEN